MHVIMKWELQPKPVWDLTWKLEIYLFNILPSFFSTTRASARKPAIVECLGWGSTEKQCLQASYTGELAEVDTFQRNCVVEAFALWELLKEWGAMACCVVFLSYAQKKLEIKVCTRCCWTSEPFAMNEEGTRLILLQSLENYKWKAKNQRYPCVLLSELVSCFWWTLKSQRHFKLVTKSTCSLRLLLYNTSTLI